jgi:hypothetical protein
MKTLIQSAFDWKVLCNCTGDPVDLSLPPNDQAAYVKQCTQNDNFPKSLASSTSDPGPLTRQECIKLSVMLQETMRKKRKKKKDTRSLPPLPDLIEKDNDTADSENVHSIA